MNIGEILALSKAGFKASEIKELMAQEKEDIKKEEIPSDIPSQPSGGDNPPSPEVKEEDAPKESVQPSEKEKEMQSEIESLKKQINKLQLDNQRKDLSGEVKDTIEEEQKTIEDLVRSFM